MDKARDQLAVDASRLGKPSWKDPRLLLGILIVLASCVGVVALTSSMDRTTPMYSAKADISLGEEITAEKLNVVNVKLDALEAGYVPADASLLAGTRANSLIRAGQLLPRSALGLDDGTNRRPVSIDLPDALPSAITSGAHVDVWVSLKDRSANAYSPPTLLLPAAEVTARTERATGFGGTAGTLVEILVVDTGLADLLEAMANDARITVVFNPGASAS
ncbi:SAF domain-containing protein [Paeniglutamicibacter sp. MACA_103]|uniref:SAF domain-containing protein n=1 Tax=Paeniglutamicibacter sp. MACA_103 TaxID=3377337 RepID=UPI00389398BD